LLIFDEPFSGFDPVNAEQLKQEILRLKDQGSTILFSTHNMESVEAICERITLINSARVVLEGSVAAIKQEHKKHLYEIEQVDRAATLPTNDTLYSIEQTTRNSTLIRLNDGVASRDVISWLNEHVQLAGFHELLPSMNEIFIETVKALKS
jgi:ABC-2 type transport system ATP-binding protein